jgi:hypothetical protein
MTYLLTHLPNLFTYLIIFNLLLTYLSIHLLTYMPTLYFVSTKIFLPNYLLPPTTYLPTYYGLQATYLPTPYT